MTQSTRRDASLYFPLRPGHEISTVAVGAGPSNLSLAALARTADVSGLQVLEARSSAAWHPGLLLPRSRLQGSFLRDLVTPIEPRSEYSFLNFLHVKRRLNGFLTKHQGGLLRAELSSYLEWVAERVSTSFNDEVLDISFDGGGFVVESTRQTIRAKNVVVGSGATPFVPNESWLKLENVWHTGEHLTAGRHTAGKRVAIVGGGQSAAEIFLHLLDAGEERPQELVWLTGRNGLRPRDQSPFTDVLFQPSYGRYFAELSAERRSDAAARVHGAIAGISDEVLRDVYDRMYALDALGPRDTRQQIFAGSEVVDLEADADGSIQVTMRNVDSARTSKVDVDAVILATGYKKRVPQFLSSLLARLQVADGVVETDGMGRARFDGPSGNGLYVHAGPSSSAGVGGQTLGLVAWRSARILNDIAEEELFDMSPDWSAQSHGLPPLETQSD